MRLAIVTGRSGGPRQIDADPDNDVRAEAAQPQRGPQGTRPRRLAHSLLFPVVLLTLISSMSACVVPVAPNFHDPVGAPNVPPYIEGAIPDIGSLVSPGGQVQVTVTDQNVGDTLYYQWVLDYPPLNPSITRKQGVFPILPSADGTQLHVSKTFSPCGDLIPAPTIAVHLLEFILADRLLDKTNQVVLDALLPGETDGFVVRANWTFSCP